MQKQKREKILAVDPGSKETGVAVLDGNELVYYGIKTFKKRSPVSSLLFDVNRVFLNLMKEHNPTTLVIEKTLFHKNKNVSNLIAVVEEIKAVAKQKRLKVVEFAPTTIRKFICRSGKATKRETAIVLCSRFPELQLHLNQDRKWKEKYWQNMFDAVAVGIAYLENGEKQKF